MSMWLSKLAPHLQQFEETKKALGYTYRRQSESLHSFDKFCFENFSHKSFFFSQDIESFFYYRQGYGPFAGKRYAVDFGNDFAGKGK